MRTLTRILLGILSLSLAACANLQTIGRTTSLPSGEEGGVAIHLDAQQRLLIYNKMGKYCAEPSPDALAAYAASLGLGASVPGQGAASVAQALQSSAGSIGLRTQSITLMRDTLYRLCEAYANGVIEPVQVATLMGRNQDLTAVVLAIEQLTGAVAANQVILTGTAGAEASASLVGNQQLLDAARKDEEAKKKSLADAEAARDKVKTMRDDKQAKVTTADINYKKAIADGSTVPQETQDSLRTDLEKQQSELIQLQANLGAAEAQVETKTKFLAESQKVRETVESLKDTALTNAVANTTSAGKFAIPIQRKELSQEATQTIATAVEGMVKHVLNKNYTLDTCMAFITNSPADFDKWTELRKLSYTSVQDKCAELVTAGITDAITKIDATFRPNKDTDRIEKALSVDPALRGKLKDWLQKNGLRISPTTLLYGSEYAEDRRKAIEELSIK